MHVELARNIAAEVESYWTRPHEVRREPTPTAYRAYLLSRRADGHCMTDYPTVEEYRAAYWDGLTERPRDEDESATLADVMALLRRIGWDNPTLPSQYDYTRLYRERYPELHPSPAAYRELTK